MTTGSDDRDAFVRNAMEATIKIGAALIVILYCFELVKPFIGIVAWGIIIAVAMYPLAVRVSQWMGGRQKTAVVVMTLLMLVILVIPSVELAAIVVENVEELADKLDEESLRIPMPPDNVATWPIIGQQVADFWTLAATNLEQALKIVEPQIRAVGTWLVSSLAGIGLGVLQFVAAIIIAGVFMANAKSAGSFARALGRRLAGSHGEDLTRLSEATVRGVARGVIGVAFIQTTLAGIGLVVADIPAAGIWTLACLLLAIIQLGIAPVMIGAIIYMFSTADTLPAVIFMVYALVISASDNVLKPILMGRGLDVPMLVILVGTIGGMLLQGIVGLFIGAVILALGYKLFVAWVYDTDPETEDATTAS
ncbi:MAG: AI-2E family transporter [Gammaproteobacteria bacterium]